jgi:hypothetical protein
MFTWKHTFIEELFNHAGCCCWPGKTSGPWSSPLLPWCSLVGFRGFNVEYCPFQLVSNQIVTWVGTSRSPKKKCMGSQSYRLWLRCIPHNMGMLRFGIGDKTVKCTVGGGSAQVPHMFLKEFPIAPHFYPICFDKCCPPFHLYSWAKGDEP